MQDRATMGRSAGQVNGKGTSLHVPIHNTIMPCSNIERLADAPGWQERRLGRLLAQFIGPVFGIPCISWSAITL